jgi:hypothetical protein
MLSSPWLAWTAAQPTTAGPTAGIPMNASVIRRKTAR